MAILSRALAVASVVFLLGSGTARACSVEGKVYCVDGGLPLVGIQVQLYLGDPAAGGTAFGDPATTDEHGAYWFALESFVENVWVAPVLGPGATFLAPAGPVPVTTDGFSQDFVVSDPERCGVLGCWLTGGGAKINRITNAPVAEKGPKINFGGNVNPGCSPTSGAGGNWNHLDKAANYHFQAEAIQVIECGNVAGIPPGSTSPVTPYNYLLWQGQGRAVKPVTADVTKGDPVCFRAKAEDRNEPGSNGARDGALVDRYYFEVFDCDSGASLYRVGTEADPVPITDGNLQLHVSSCDAP